MPRLMGGSVTTLGGLEVTPPRAVTENVTVGESIRPKGESLYLWPTRFLTIFGLCCTIGSDWFHLCSNVSGVIVLLKLKFA